MRGIMISSNISTYAEEGIGEGVHDTAFPGDGTDLSVSEKRIITLKTGKPAMISIP